MVTFRRVQKLLAEAKMMQHWRDVLKYFIKLWLCNTVTALAVGCYNVDKKSFCKVVTTLPADIVTMSLCLLGMEEVPLKLIKRYAKGLRKPLAIGNNNDFSIGMFPGNVEIACAFRQHKCADDKHSNR